jgi:hypothetical protein
LLEYVSSSQLPALFICTHYLYNMKSNLCKQSGSTIFQRALFCIVFEYVQIMIFISGA